MVKKFWVGKPTLSNSIEIKLFYKNSKMTNVLAKLLQVWNLPLNHMSYLPFSAVNWLTKTSLTPGHY